jgi:hypothetical protein
MSSVVIHTGFPQDIKKLVRSCHHDDYDNSEKTKATIDYSISFSKKYDTTNFINFFKNYDAIQEADTLDLNSVIDINIIINNTDFVLKTDLFDSNFSTFYYPNRYHDDYPTYYYNLPIIVKLNRSMNNLYCVLRNINLEVECASCDGETSCSLKVILYTNLHDVIYYGLTDGERAIYNIDNNEIENIKNLSEKDIIKQILSQRFIFNQTDIDLDNNYELMPYIGINIILSNSVINYFLKTNEIGNKLFSKNNLNKKLADVFFSFN